MSNLKGRIAGLTRRQHERAGGSGRHEVVVRGGLPMLDESGRAVSGPHCFAHSGDGQPGERFTIEPHEDTAAFVARVRDNTDRHFLVWSGIDGRPQ
jgi:hypothetical protein